MSEADPSEIRRLAAQIGGDPLRALEAAEELIWVSEHKAELRAWARRNIRIEMSWEDGIKTLTGESRLAYARTKFAQFLKRTRLSGMTEPVYHPNLRTFIRITRGLGDWQAQGFTHGELESLGIKFELLKCSEVKISANSEKKFLEAGATIKNAPAAKKSRKATKK